MSRVRALVFVGSLLLPIGPAWADIPTIGTCDIGKGVTLGGTSAGIADPLTLKSIVIRDGLDQPIPSSTVSIDFGACVNAGEIRLCSAQPDPGIIVSCGTRVVTAVTDANGIARFHIVGYALNPGGGTPGSPAPGYGPGGATVRADGVTLGTLVVSAYNQNGQGGVNTVDLALFLNDRFSITGLANLRGRSDYNADGAVNPLDLALLLRARGAGGSTASCASVCP